MTHQEKLAWIQAWADECKPHNVVLQLEGYCGAGRECVCIGVNGEAPEYFWYNDGYSEKPHQRADLNGHVWIPKDAYHRADCLAVLGRGKAAEIQLYSWLQWFDKNEFKLEIHEHPRMVRQRMII